MIVVAVALQLLLPEWSPHVSWTATGSFRLHGEYPSTDLSGAHAPHYGSFDGSDARTGRLVSAPFVAPPILAIEAAGGTTSNSNESVEITGPGGRRLTFKPASDAGESYVTFIKRLPVSWWYKPIILSAIDNGGGFRGWLGIAAVRAATPADVINLFFRPLIRTMKVDNNAYVGVGWLLAIVTMVLACRLPATAFPSGRRDALFLFALFAFLLWLRLPVVSTNHYFDVDEPDLTALAINATFDPVPWRSFDGATAGPMDVYVLAVPAVFRIPLSIASTHVMGLLLLFATAIAIFWAGRALYGARVASAGAYFFVAFEGATHAPDFVHTSTEYLPNCLVALALAGLARIYIRGNATSAFLAFASGLAIGAIPFAKLQAAPTALILAVLGIVLLHRTRMVAFLVGATCVGVVLGGVVLVTGEVRDAFISYVGQNLAYTAGSLPYWNATSFMFANDATFRAFTYSVAAFCVIAVGVASFTRHSRPSMNILGPAAVCLVLIASAIVEIALPHRAFPHYLSLLLVPLSATVTVALAYARKLPTLQPPGKSTTVFLLCGFATLWIFQFAMNTPLLGFERPGAIPTHDAVAMKLQELVDPGETITVWGWRPDLYVSSQTRGANRDGGTVFQILAGPNRDYYRDRYLHDLEQHPAAAVVDVVSPGAFGFTDRKDEGLESFPAVWQLVQQHYRKVWEQNGVRIFTRR